MADEPFMPQVIMLSEVEAELKIAMAEKPEIGQAMTAFKENVLNAMQAVHDGRYKTFEDAMEAIGGIRPVRIAPPNPPVHGYYSGIMPDPKGDGYIVVITDGHPHNPEHKPIRVMDTNRLKSREEADAWAAKIVEELPWRTDDAT